MRNLQRLCRRARSPQAQIQVRISRSDREAVDPEAQRAPRRRSIGKQVAAGTTKPSLGWRTISSMDGMNGHRRELVEGVQRQAQFRGGDFRDFHKAVAKATGVGAPLLACRRMKRTRWGSRNIERGPSGHRTVAEGRGEQRFPNDAIERLDHNDHGEHNGHGPGKVHPCSIGDDLSRGNSGNSGGRVVAERIPACLQREQWPLAFLRRMELVFDGDPFNFRFAK